MSRSNKGGARLRAITLFAGASAIAAGVLAAYGHKPLTEACDIVPTSIFGSKTVHLQCTGLTAMTSYKIASNGDSIWSASNLGSGNATSAANAYGLNGGAFSFTAGGSTVDLYFNTASSGTTDASTNLKLQTSGGVDIVNSDSVPGYYVSFTVPGSPVQGGNGFQVGASGLLSSTAGYKLGSIDPSTLAPTSNGLESSSSPSGDGSSGSPYVVDSTNSYRGPSLSSDSSNPPQLPTKYFTAKSSYDGSAMIGLYDSSGTLIGASASFDISSF